MLAHQIPISLGDMATAIRKLDADVETQQAIASALGLHWNKTRISTSDANNSNSLEEHRPIIDGSTNKPKRPKEQTQRNDEIVEKIPKQEETGDARVDVDGIDAEVGTYPTIQLTHLGRYRPPWEFEVEPLKLVPQGSSPRLPFEPLLVSLRTRAILFEALAIGSTDRILDLEQIIENISQVQITQQLPMLSKPTLMNGVQLLVDRADTMIPFSKDQSWLIQEVRKIVGRSNTTVLNFSNTPMRAGAGPKTRWTRYQPPNSRTPVMVLSDLGIGRPPTGRKFTSWDEWLDFANVLKNVRCPLIIFVPYPEERWPKVIAEKLMIIPWNRTTTSGEIRSITGKGHIVE